MPVTDVVELTGVPAILGHRVVTLHPKVHGGILADPTDAEHRADMAEYGIEPIDLVVANLYPFGSDSADFAHGGGKFGHGDGFVAADVEHLVIRAVVFKRLYVGIDDIEVIDEVAHLMAVFIDHRIAACHER